MIGRRALLAVSAAGLGGCGFRPLYGRFGAGGAAASPELASIFVAVMPERSGQLLRQALQARLGGAGEDVTKLYELKGDLAIAAEAIGVQQDTSSTRLRFNATGTWVLTRLDAASTVVTKGAAKAIDGVNVNNQEYFAVDLETSSAYRRLAEQVANQITIDLAVYFRTHPAPAVVARG